jgi:hypothetical protein
MDRRAGPGEDVVRAVFDQAIALHGRVRDLVPGPVVAAAAALPAAVAPGGKRLVF